MYAIRSYYAPAPKPKKYSALSPLVLVDIDYRTPTLMGSFDIAPIKRAWGQAKDIASGSIADAIIFGRITSYNVCYTKLLRFFKTFFVFYSLLLVLFFL